LGIFALVFAVLTVLPTLYLPAIALGNFVHDRFLYLPSVGIVILAALVIEQIFSSKVVRQTGVPLKWGMLAILCAAAFAGTIRHQTQWANNFLLYENALRYAPQNSIVEVNLANEFANLGQYDRALALYLSSLQNDPHSWLSNYSLGYAYYRNGRLSDSENYLKRAIQIDDEDADQFIYLALTQLKRQELVAATENAERALQRAPLSPGFHLVLGKIREARGDRATAIAEYKAEVASHPESAVAVSELKRLQSSQ
jgi:tetratricopeptide (TPR) repeat protein